MYVCYTLQEHVKTLYVLHSPFYLLWRSFTCNLDIVSCILTTSSPALFFSALYSSRRPTISTFLDVQGYKLRKLFCFFVFSKYAFVKWKNLLNVECSFGANLEYNRGISGKKNNMAGWLKAHCYGGRKIVLYFLGDISPVREGGRSPVRY